MTVPAAAYYLRGDQCPRCLTAMQPLQRFRSQPSDPDATQGTTGSLRPEGRRPSA